MSEMSWLVATATCRICGELVALVEAPLHIEDHEQRGEFPPLP